MNDEYAAFCLDEAVIKIEQMASETDDKGELKYPTTLWQLDEEKRKRKKTKAVQNPHELLKMLGG